MGVSVVPGVWGELLVGIVDPHVNSGDEAGSDLASWPGRWSIWKGAHIS